MKQNKYFLIIFLLNIFFGRSTFADSKEDFFEINESSFKSVNEEYYNSFGRPERSKWNDKIEQILEEGKVYSLDCPATISYVYPSMDIFDDSDFPNDLIDKRLRIKIDCVLGHKEGINLGNQLFLETYHESTKISKVYGGITSKHIFKNIVFSSTSINNGSFVHAISGIFKIKFKVTKMLWCKKDICELNPATDPLCKSGKGNTCFSKENFNNYYHVFISIIEAK